MNKQGIALIEGLVLCVILLIFVSLISMNLVVADTDEDKTTDISNLKNLVGIYISGQCEKKPTPKSKGHRFWLAMFIGDSKDVTGGLTIADAYANPSQSGNLLCPADKGARSKSFVETTISLLVKNNKSGWDAIDDDDGLYTSYAGPSSRKVFTDKKNSGIVGADGSRDEKGFFDGGFCTVNSSQGAEFKEYDDLSEMFPQDWTGDEKEPNWQSKLLNTLYNLDNPSGGDRKKAKDIKDIEEKTKEKPKIDPKTGDDDDDDDDDDDEVVPEDDKSTKKNDIDDKKEKKEEDK